MGTVNEPLVRLDSVALSYDGSPVLTGVDLDLRLALGTLRPTSGRVERARGLRVGYVPQLETVSWSFPVTVAECVLMVRSERWLPWATRAEKRAVAEVLDRLGIAHLADRHIRELSGGQQQRVAIARALVTQPDVLLADEPTGNLDPATSVGIMKLLDRINKTGTTVLMATHDHGIVDQMRKRVIELDHGRVVRDEARKAEVVANATKDADNRGLPADKIEQIWDLLVEASIAYELAEWDRIRA